MLERKKKRTARVGVFGVAHQVYWNQFEGLQEKLMGYHEDLKKLIGNNEVEIIDYGMVDNNKKAFQVLKKMQGGELDIVFCNMLTYATSSVFAPIIRDLNIPIILIALQPLKRLDTGERNTRAQLENDNICAVPEFINNAKRFGKEIQDVIIGTLFDDDCAKEEIFKWCEIAKVLHDFKGARFGLMGHVLESMYDMHSDPTMVSSAFGIHVPLLEIDNIIKIYSDVNEEEINNRKKVILEYFDTPEPKSDPITEKLSKKDLYNAARASVALDKFVEENELTGFAYYYNGMPDSIEREAVSSFIVGNSLLNAQGVPMCGEYDIKTCIAMFIMDRLNIGGSFAEFHPFDFVDDFIYVGHDGPHHIAIAEGKPLLRSLKKYHGKPGGGASVEFKIKEGPITMLSITETFNGKFKFIIGEGFSKAGEIPPTGNTNTRGFFEPTTKEFIKKWVMSGPTHHFSLGIGHHADVIGKIAKCLGIEYEIIGNEL